MAKRIDVRSDLLKRDRESQRLSQNALSQLTRERGHAPISESSIQRIELQGRASLAHIQALAKALGTLPSRYVLDAEEKPPRIQYDLSGAWTALYLEQEDDGTVYVAEEELILSQSGSSLHRLYRPSRTENPTPGATVGDRPYELTAKAYDDFVSGSYAPLDNRSQGTGYCVLKIMREGMYCEGFCTYYSIDKNIAGSINIWIKKDIKDYSATYYQTLSKIRRFKDRLLMVVPLIPSSFG